MRLVTLFTAVALGLAACGSSQPVTLANPTVPEAYQARVDTGPNEEPIQIPAVRAAYLTERNQRQQVSYNGPEAPGSIVVDPYARVLYLVQPGGQAMRYGVAIGRGDLYEPGVYTIKRKAEWPHWTPTQNMIQREPEIYDQFAGGVEPGPQNALGSRALYLYVGDRDTYLRIHGTPFPTSIGSRASSGCVRMVMSHINALYPQVQIGSTAYLYSPDGSVTPLS